MMVTSWIQASNKQPASYNQPYIHELDIRENARARAFALHFSCSPSRQRHQDFFLVVNVSGDYIESLISVK
jgi:hypothetical protein